jgi:hypothetical protein
MEVAAVLVALALLLYAGWRGTWLPLQLALLALALRLAWRHAPLAVLALWLWPGDDG